MRNLFDNIFRPACPLKLTAALFSHGALEGIVTKTDILRALRARGISRVRDHAGKRART